MLERAEPRIVSVSCLIFAKGGKVTKIDGKSAQAEVPKTKAQACDVPSRVPAREISNNPANVSRPLAGKVKKPIQLLLK